MSKINDTERTRELEAKRAELLDAELDKVSGGVVKTIGGKAKIIDGRFST